MKYMGSKRAMLQNGLGDLLRSCAKKQDRFVDLFTGSASVAWFVAERSTKQVLAIDLQEYAVVLARSVLDRTSHVDSSRIAETWLGTLESQLGRSTLWRAAMSVEDSSVGISDWVVQSRNLCATRRGSGEMWRSYGGYYFSPRQAVILDKLRSNVPPRGPARWLCTAALIIAASKCAAAPGHTAQPFGATKSAGRFLQEAWTKDIVEQVHASLTLLCSKYAKVRGTARVADAVRAASYLSDGDLVFIDPPYSGVHYSRFYHVLETLARGSCSEVSGTGRYPPPAERPVSQFSKKTSSFIALDSLLRRLANVGCTVIVTFPAHDCSNGLSGKIVTECADSHFAIDRRLVKSRFSTLGGNGRNRSARHDQKEMMLLLKPK